MAFDDAQLTGFDLLTGTFWQLEAKEAHIISNHAADALQERIFDVHQPIERPALPVAGPTSTWRSGGASVSCSGSRRASARRDRPARRGSGPRVGPARARTSQHRLQPGRHRSSTDGPCGCHPAGADALGWHRPGVAIPTGRSSPSSSPTRSFSPTRSPRLHLRRGGHHPALAMLVLAVSTVALVLHGLATGVIGRSTMPTTLSFLDRLPKRARGEMDCNTRASTLCCCRRCSRPSLRSSPICAACRAPSASCPSHPPSCLSSRTTCSERTISSTSPAGDLPAAHPLLSLRAMPRRDTAADARHHRRARVGDSARPFPQVAHLSAWLDWRKTHARRRVQRLWRVCQGTWIFLTGMCVWLCHPAASDAPWACWTTSVP